MSWCEKDECFVRATGFNKMDTLTERLFHRGSANISIFRITKSLASRVKTYGNRIRKNPAFKDIPVPDGVESGKCNRSGRNPKDLAGNFERQRICPVVTVHHATDDYEDDIDDYLRELEITYQYALNDTLRKQKEITREMRLTLINWIVKVHSFYKFSPETLYLTISLMDSYLRRKSVSPGRFQLLGLTTFYIGVKYEEGINLNVEDLAYLSDRACFADDILKMELKVLKKLDFSLGRPLAVHFLNRLLLQPSLDKDDHFPMLTRYILELTLFDDSLRSRLPSHLAAAASILAKTILCPDDQPELRRFANVLLEYSGTTIRELNPTVQELKELLKSSVVDEFSAIKNKYNHKIFHEVSSLTCLRLLE